MKARFALTFVATLAAALVAPRAVRAQEYLPAGAVQIASGIESAGKRVDRARTRLRVSGELRVDEAPNDGVSFGAIVDLEPHAALGADLRYEHLIGTTFVVNAGAIGYLTPGTLVGGCAGGDARVRMSKGAWLTLGPEVTVFALGSDLPDGVVMWQALLQGGIRVDL